MDPSPPVVAESARLYRLLARGSRSVSFSGESVRAQARDTTLLADTAVACLEDITVRRGWLSSSLSLSTAGGTPVTVSGLDRRQAASVHDAVLDAAARRSATAGPDLVQLVGGLRQLLQTGRYVRRDDVLAAHADLASAVRQFGGLVARCLEPDAREALDWLRQIEAVDRFEELRTRVNDSFVLGRVTAVKQAAHAALGARLTDEQAEAIATDEHVTLVRAGAGTGKTTVIAGKVAHLVHNEGVDPRQILVLAFNVKARDEIKARLKGDLGGAEVQNFHQFGRSIVAACDVAPTLSKMATDDHVRRSTIDSILDDLSKDPEMSAVVASYLLYHSDPGLSPFDFETYEEYDAYCRSVELRTLSGDRVISYEELTIANYLTENGIDFNYELKYQFDTATRDRRQYQPDFYLPDYDIYIEHFALDENHNPPPYWTGYARGVEWKLRTHQRRGTTLVTTYSWEHKRGVLLQNLRHRLRAHGVAFDPVPRQELIRRLADTKVSRLSGLLASFLDHVKTSNVGLGELRFRACSRRDRYRTLAFLDVFSHVHERYQQRLADAAELDFHDYINGAARLIRNRSWRPPYRYVLVDEFQDISIGRMELLAALRTEGVAYFLVGDDWQSIYRFAGSDVQLMRDCGRHLGHVRKRTLGWTFRYAGRILAPSTGFVRRNPEQTQRSLRSKSTARDDGITVIAAHNDEEGVRRALAEIGRASAGERPDVLMLGRYRKRKEPVPAGPEFTSVHRAKGREADHVIVLDLKDRRWGFPSRFTDDPILDLVKPSGGKDGLPFAEERRLFYVALTRARNGAYLVTDPRFPSPFVVELLEQSDDVHLIGELVPPVPCPRCPNGSLVVSQTQKRLRCTEHPRCQHQAPRCRHCDDGYVVVEAKYRAACTNTSCHEPPDVCPSCGLGVVVPIPDQAFEGCTEYWSEPRCRYTRDTTKRPPRRRG